MRHLPFRPRRWSVILALTSASFTLTAAERLRITPIVRDNTVFVSFEADEAYNDSVRDAILSGLRTTFTYQLELRTKVPAWLDRTIATTVVTLSDHYDNLVRRHTLTRVVDGRVEEVSTTNDEAVVRAWLTKRSLVPLCGSSTLDPTRDYYVRVTAQARPWLNSSLGLPRTFSGQTKFTFIP
jgi:Domain of unknown function (DUF4390)